MGGDLDAGDPGRWTDEGAMSMGGDAGNLPSDRPASAARLRAMAGQLDAAWDDDAERFAELMEATRWLDEACRLRLGELLGDGLCREPVGGGMVGRGVSDGRGGAEARAGMGDEAWFAFEADRAR